MMWQASAPLLDGILHSRPACHCHIRRRIYHCRWFAPLREPRARRSRLDVRPHLKRNQYSSYSLTRSIEFGCEYNQKVNPGKCWRMCDGSTSSKPLWCYAQKKKPITCNNAAACGFDWPCLGPCTATYYPEGPRGTSVPL